MYSGDRMNIIDIIIYKLTCLWLLFYLWWLCLEILEYMFQYVVDILEYMFEYVEDIYRVGMIVLLNIGF